jgi:predicted porin
LKGGVAYRQLELNDRTSSRDHLKKWNGELQAGLGYQLTQHGRLVAYYQRIFSESTAGIKLTTDDEITISQIPTQQGGFIGVEFSL